MMWGYLEILSIAAILLHVHFCDGVSVAGHGSVSQAGKTFRITQVTKTETTTDFYTVRVEYEASSKPTFVLMRQSYRGSAELQENQNIGAVEVQVPKKSNALDYTILTFSYPDHYFTAYLQVSNTPNTMEVPRITAEVAQGSDVTFQPGSLPELDFTFKVDGDLHAVKGDSVHCRVMLKSDTEDNRVDSYFSVDVGMRGQQDEVPVWLDIVSLQGWTGDWHATVLINSTLEDPRGILECTASVRFNCTENCLVDTLDSAAQIRFYRDDHSGPFPEGFLGFVHDQDSADPSRVFCDVSEPNYCNIACEVAGSDPSTAELTKILPSGDVMPTDALEMSDGHWSGSNLKMVNVTYADAGDYRCTAKSGSKDITMDISLVVFKAARINKNLAFVTEWMNGSLSATCTAEGNPGPNVTFDTGFYPLSDASPDDYDVTMTKLDASRTRADIMVINPAVASNMYSFECRARNIDNLDKYGSPEDYYSIYVNEEDNYANYTIDG
ncbi:uncharacterized protein [Littorina saxatilis]|uniref:uncharacterized protein n=1 Tax=Littorina saxatilis TaxID=31220 RepID=UPI0038B465D4